MSYVKVISLVDGNAGFEFDFPSLLGLTYEGKFKEDILIQYYAPLRDRVSMANIGLSMFDILKNHFDKLALHNYCAGGLIDDRFSDYAFLNQNAPVGIYLGVPDQVNETFYQHAFKIGGFVCETDAISPEWVRICNRMDLVFVPSTWCQSAFVRSGVSTPVIVVPHGLDSEYSPYKKKPQRKPFVFYNTFRAGSLGSRKGMEELIRSFLQAFDGYDDVVLRLRTDDSPILQHYQKKYDFGKLIEVEYIENLATTDFAKIYSEVHCTVHLSKGEGFGLIPFQSIACETPVIAPHVTGMADYLNSQNSMALNTNGRESGKAVGNQSGTYFSIDESHLIECLRSMYSNWEREYEKVRSIGEIFRTQHAWETVMADFIFTLKDIINNKCIHNSKNI